MAEKKWYYTGDEGEKRAEEVKEEMIKQATGARRFWLKEGNEALVTFLDNTPFFIHEHNLRIGGKWGNYFTCLQEFDNCPICEAGHRPYFACIYTIIDHSTYKTKAGKEVKNQKKLLVLKRTAYEIIMDRKKNDLDNDLTYVVFRTKRHKADDPNTGGDWVVKKRLDLATVKRFIPSDIDVNERDDYLKPFNYIDIFQPKEADALRRIVGGAAPVGSNADPATSAGSDDIPAIGDDDLEKYL